MLRIIVFNCIGLLWQLIFFNSEVHGDVLKCKIIDGVNEIHLNWIKTDQLLANEHLPVWIATDKKHKNSQENKFVLEHELKHDFIKKNLGNFTLYHDVKKNSAIVYYHDIKLIDGTVDTRYIIKMMPVHKCNLGLSVDGNYVTKLPEEDTFHDYKEILDFSVLRDDKLSTGCSSSSEYEPPKKMRRIYYNSNEVLNKIFYPEILIFIPYEIVHIIKYEFPTLYLSSIVAHYISYFNSVDMLFAKLLINNIKIRLNLAGIIIEDRNFPMDIKTFGACYSSDNPHGYLNTEQAIDVISKYIDANRNVFPEDSFDFAFMPSRYKFISSQIKDLEILGKSGYFNMYEERYSKKTHRRSLVSLVQDRTTNEFIVAAHEIAHLMNLTHDACSEGLYFNDRQCFAIMQLQGRYCPNCLKWSEESLKALESYARDDPSHCFLLNFPRSLYVHGTPFVTLSPSDQCRCYGYDPLNSQYSDMVSAEGCSEILSCNKEGNKVKTILPLDGTPCGKGKVCWDRKCISEYLVTESEASSSGTSCSRGQS